MNAELKNILLVEDDPRDVELTLAALDEHKLANKVTLARDGEEDVQLRQIHRRARGVI